MERVIGATNLRQNLTDVLQAVREQRATYIVETFGRSQAAIVNLDEYRQFRHYQDKKNQDFERLDRIAALNAEHVHSLGLTEEDVLALIEQAREEVYQEHIQSCSES
jgi:PHD/YefM family antitoxin component YafN of YafNO toxin-antitoxin module